MSNMQKKLSETLNLGALDMTTRITTSTRVSSVRPYMIGPYDHELHMQRYRSLLRRADNRSRNLASGVETPPTRRVRNLLSGLPRLLVGRSTREETFEDWARGQLRESQARLAIGQKGQTAPQAADAPAPATEPARDGYFDSWEPWARRNPIEGQIIPEPAIGEQPQQSVAAPANEPKAAESENQELSPGAQRRSLPAGLLRALDAEPQNNGLKRQITPPPAERDSKRRQTAPPTPPPTPLIWRRLLPFDPFAPQPAPITGHWSVPDHVVAAWTEWYRQISDEAERQGLTTRGYFDTLQLVRDHTARREAAAREARRTWFHTSIEREYRMIAQRDAAMRATEPGVILVPAYQEWRLRTFDEATERARSVRETRETWAMQWSDTARLLLLFRLLRL